MILYIDKLYIAKALSALTAIETSIETVVRRTKELDAHDKLYIAKALSALTAIETSIETVVRRTKELDAHRARETSFIYLFG